MEKYLVCLMIMLACISVHLLIVDTSLKTIKDYLRVIAKEMLHRDVLKEELEKLFGDLDSQENDLK